MIPGRATSEGTRRFAERFPAAREAGHFRRLGDLWVSSIGLGTYLGEPTAAVDARYEAAVLEAVSRGCNLFDTAINYRHQRSERALGRALRTAFERGLLTRDEVIVCTKGGFVAFDGEVPDEPAAYLRRTLFDAGVVEPGELVAEAHSLAPRFLAAQLAASRENLGLETVDLYYLHNPETQAEAVEAVEATPRLEAAFSFLESRLEAGDLGAYGIATWHGLRRAPGAPGSLSLEAVRDLAGPGFAAVQAPLNVAMPEALAAPTQVLGEVAVPLAVAARSLGLGLIGSASLLQGRADRLPEEFGQAMPGLATDAQRALQFARSLPGVTAALAGMSSVAHVRENLRLATEEPASMERIQQIFV